jgi:hypothetical protein
MINMPYCENCGQLVNPNANFCRKCGAPQKQEAQTNSTASAAPTITPSPTITPAPVAEPSKPQTPTQQASTEIISSFIIVYRQKRFGGRECFTGILTSQRLIFVPMTNDMLKEVTNITRQQAKNKDNSGVSIVYPYQQNYLGMAPASISQIQGTLAIETVSLKEINIKQVDVVSDGYSDFQEYQLQAVSDFCTLDFRMTKREEYVSRLRTVYQEKLRLR